MNGATSLIKNDVKLKEEYKERMGGCIHGE
jgi:hypothetical protein